MGVLGKIMVQLGLDSSGFTKGTKDAESTTESFGNKIKGMAVKAAGAIGALTLLKKAFNFGKQAYNTAAQAEGVERAFARLNNPNLLGDLRVATQGTVSDLELMQNAIQAKNFKIPLENLATYLKFANTRAKETGQSVDYLVQSIVLGVGRKSPLILDNLGISALEVREEFAKTGDMAKAVANIIDREMGHANTTIEGSKEKIGQVSASWSNFIVNLGQTSVIKTVGNAINDFLVGALNKLNDLLTSLGNNEVQTWLGLINTEKDVEKAELMAQKLRDVNDEIAKLEKNSPKSGFMQGLANVGANISAIFGVETDYAKLGKLRNYRMSIYDQQKNDAVTAATNEAILTINLKTKTNNELLQLQKKYAGNSEKVNNQALRNAISEELKLRADAELKASEIATEEAKKRAEEIKKAQLSYKKSGVLESISQLKLQKNEYGNTLAYMEQMLSLSRELEQYATSDEEYLKQKKVNDALEAQINLKKKTEPKSERQTIEDKIESLQDKQWVIPISIGVEEAQRQFDILQIEIDALKKSAATFPKDYSAGSLTDLNNKIAAEETKLKNLKLTAEQYAEIKANVDKLHEAVDNLPQNVFQEGSATGFDQQISALDEKIKTLTGSELAAAQAARAMLEFKKEGTANGWQTQLEREIAWLDLLKKALEKASDAQKKYAQEAVDAQQQVVDNLGKTEKKIVDFGAQLSSQLGSALADSLGNMFDALFSGDEEKTAQEKTQAILAPFADMIVQLGEYTLAMGVAGVAIKALIEEPWLAIAAGAALIALGKVAQAGVKSIVAGNGAPTNSDTFTGGYSNGGSDIRTANSLQLAAPQVVVLETRVSGSDIIFVSEKAKIRKKL